MVTCVDDIVEELSPIAKPAKPSRTASNSVSGEGETSAATRKTPMPEEPLIPRKIPEKRNDSRPEAVLSAEEAAIMRSVTPEGVSMDAVARSSGLPIRLVGTLVVGLRLKGRIRLLPGNRVSSI